MDLTEEQLRIASLIDEKVKVALRQGAGPLSVVAHMVDHMPHLKRLFEIANPAEMDELASRFDGLHRYAKILESLAVGIQSGRIKMPQE